MLKYIYDDITNLKEKVSYKLMNQFLGSSTPRLLPKILKKFVKPLIFQLGFSFVVFLVGLSIFLMSFSFEDVDRIGGFSIGSVVLLVGAYAIIFYFKEYCFIIALKKGKLEEWNINGIDFPVMNRGRKGANLYLTFSASKTETSELKKVFIEEDFITYFKNILDLAENPKIDVLHYSFSVAVPIVFMMKLEQFRK